MNNDLQKGGVDKKGVQGQNFGKDASVQRPDKSASGRQDMKTKHESQPEIADDDIDSDDTLKQ